RAAIHLARETSYSAPPPPLPPREKPKAVNPVRRRHPGYPRASVPSGGVSFSAVVIVLRSRPSSIDSAEIEKIDAVIGFSQQYTDSGQRPINCGGTKTYSTSPSGASGVRGTRW